MKEEAQKPPKDSVSGTYLGQVFRTVCSKGHNLGGPVAFCPYDGEKVNPNLALMP